MSRAFKLKTTAAIIFKGPGFFLLKRETQLFVKMVSVR